MTVAAVCATSGHQQHSRVFFPQPAQKAHGGGHQGLHGVPDQLAPGVDLLAQHPVHGLPTGPVHFDQVVTQGLTELRQRVRHGQEGLLHGSERVGAFEQFGLFLHLGQEDGDVVAAFGGHTDQGMVLHVGSFAKL